VLNVNIQNPIALIDFYIFLFYNTLNISIEFNFLTICEIKANEYTSHKNILYIGTIVFGELIKSPDFHNQGFFI